MATSAALGSIRIPGMWWKEETAPTPIKAMRTCAFSGCSSRRIASASASLVPLSAKEENIARRVRAASGLGGSGRFKAPQLRRRGQQTKLSNRTALIHYLIYETPEIHVMGASRRSLASEDEVELDSANLAGSFLE